jgi:cell division protein FtsI/penicillin-binding protein 2
MKVITAAAAIDSGLVTAETLYRTHRNDERYFRLPGDGSHVWDDYMTVRDAIVHSSNIVIGKLGCDLGPERLWKYMRMFGFGGKTGIELPGEQYGILHHWKKWDKATWSRAPIGQGVSVTAIQLASAYQAIANDGVRMKPYIVSRVEDAAGDELYRHQPRELGRCVSAATARTMRKMMMDVATRQGTARRAAIRGYSIAGKTGTAQKSVGRTYAEGLYRATFCGIVPAMDPRIVVLVTLDFDAKTRYHQGGNSAGPVFKRIATMALRYLMVPPDRPDELEESEDEDVYDKVMEERAAKYRVVSKTKRKF